MVMPDISTRMEKHRDLAALWVDPGQVRALLTIAEVARQGQIAGSIGCEVLAGDDVLNMVSKFAMLLP